MLPLIAAILPAVAPWLMRQFSSDAPREVTAAAEAAIIAVTGATNVEAAVSAIAKAPAMVADLRLKFAEIAERQQQAELAARLEELKIEVASTEQARQSTLELAKLSSPLAYGAATMSSLVLGLNLIMLWLLFTGNFPEHSKDIILIVSGQVLGWGTAAVSYWLGSSAGSAQKSQQLEQRRN